MIEKQPIGTRLRVAYGMALNRVSARIAEVVMIARVEAAYGVPRGAPAIRYALAFAARRF